MLVRLIVKETALEKITRNSAWSHVNTENLRFEEHLQVSSHVRPDKRPRNSINKHISMCADSAPLYNVVINGIFMWVTCGRNMLGRRKQQNRAVCSPGSASVKIITIEWWLSSWATAGPVQLHVVDRTLTSFSCCERRPSEGHQTSQRTLLILTLHASQPPLIPWGSLLFSGFVARIYFTAANS